MSKIRYTLVKLFPLKTGKKIDRGITQVWKKCWSSKNYSMVKTQKISKAAFLIAALYQPRYMTAKVGHLHRKKLRITQHKMERSIFEVKMAV